MGRPSVDISVLSSLMIQLLATVYFLCMPLGIPYGAGRHQWDVSQATFMEFLKVRSYCPKKRGQFLTFSARKHHGYLV